MSIPIYERVRRHVRKASLSNADIAQATGWSEQKVSRLLHGKTALHADHLEKLAELCNKPTGELLEDPDAGAATEAKSAS